MRRSANLLLYRLRVDRQGEIKARAFLDTAFGPDLSAVPGDNPMHDREPDTGAAELVVSVQALKNGEQLVGVAHVESGAVVLHAVGHVPILGSAGDLYPRVRAFAAVL